ncbi:FAD dependent oxidoreductase [Acidimicrobium ferrooxidans DSM 10331]|uniref:FAD dependent oxidoreductase n=1 Tax=Acidimicrobium ferrooxidans (strain DSM 10331 / JCM 15462 / NBRC 103882 / ICP) TaxID=525909 RepID=C7LYM6_ACIFD|nr:FAD-dependent oxidoreductase [Acidimicrobium ferrooxidans]ACU53834.1 FAD dependent oxidoreductase [Acidimicrobium ferrooxidans DSM 10331]
MTVRSSGGGTSVRRTWERPELLRVAEGALAHASTMPLWLDDPARPAATPPLEGQVTADLVIVGGGLLGLWSALLAAERRPEWEIVLVEGGRIAAAASGRNGGFCEASLTHGLANGLARWPDELSELERLGEENLAAIRAAAERYAANCDLVDSGTIDVALEDWQLDELAELAEVAPRYGHDVVLLEREALSAEVRSPSYRGGLWTRNRALMLNPARLAWGLEAAVAGMGVRICEGTRVVGLSSEGPFVVVETGSGASVRASRVILATNAAAPLVASARWRFVPVYDYVVATRPLAASERAEIGWERRQGISDAGNQFHYYHLSEDGRIVFGGYDAVYHYGSVARPRYEGRSPTHVRLVAHLYATFPGLEGVEISHAWGGAIDTSTRFVASVHRAFGGRVHYAVGFTGLGVGATRLYASVLVGRAIGEPHPAERLRLFREGPVPFPPEPLRWIGIELTRRSLAWADDHGGRRNVWLRALDRFGVGFDS